MQSRKDYAVIYYGGSVFIPQIRRLLAEFKNNGVQVVILCQAAKTILPISKN